MPGILRDLFITRVAAVDKGAGDGVRLVMMKRDFSDRWQDYCAWPVAKGEFDQGWADLPWDARDYLKRQFSADDRKDAARQGQAMSDGSFPIKNVSDLKNAIQAIGRAKNPKAAKQHIIRRARALGQSDLIPEGWTSTQQTKKDFALDAAATFDLIKARQDDIVRAVIAKAGAVDFDQAETQQQIAHSTGELMEAVRCAVGALDRALCSICCDEEADQQSMIEESFDQFRTHLAGLGLDEVGKAIAADVQAAHPYAKGTDAMKPEELAKAIADAVAKATQPLADLVAKQAHELEVLKFDDAERAYFGKLDTDEKKKAFIAKAKADRKTQMDDDEDDKTTKSLPADVKKALGVAASAIEKNVSLEKEINILKGDKALVAFSKRAVEIGLAEADGQLLMKAHGGDAASITALEDRLKALNAQLSSGALFAEFGKGGGQSIGNGTAYAEIRAKAEDMVKTEKAAGRTLSVHQAVAKIMVDPAHQDLVRRNKAEEMAKRFPRAA